MRFDCHYQRAYPLLHLGPTHLQKLEGLRLLPTRLTQLLLPYLPLQK